MVMLQSKDGVIFDVDRAVASRIGTIKEAMDNCGDNDNPIPLPVISAGIMGRVLTYADHHKHDPVLSPEEEAAREKDCIISDWDTAFLRVDQATLFQLVVAANFLNMGELLRITTRTVANIIKGKTAEEMRTVFNIVDDFVDNEDDKENKENKEKKVKEAEPSK